MFSHARKNTFNESNHLEPKLENDFVHPVQDIQENFSFREEKMNNFALRHVFGQHMVMRFEMEKRILSSVHRLPILRSEYCGLETITEKDLTIGFGDIFGDPYESEKTPPSLHDILEHKLKL